MKQCLLVFCALLMFPVGAYAAGAIAVDDEEGEGEPGYGLYTGANSREEAAREALKQCKASGNKNCKVVARFDTCGAYAASTQYYGVGWGSTEKAATTMAKEQCGANCRIVVSECE
jgi:hypothetical protein